MRQKGNNAVFSRDAGFSRRYEKWKNFVF